MMRQSNLSAVTDAVRVSKCSAAFDPHASESVFPAIAAGSAARPAEHLPDGDELHQ
jgi:hypothetical protein